MALCQSLGACCSSSCITWFRRSLGRERKTLRDYAGEADQLQRTEGDIIRAHLELNEKCELLGSGGGWASLSKDELDDILGRIQAANVNVPTPAKFACLGRYLVEWSKDIDSMDQKAGSLFDVVQAWSLPTEDAVEFDLLQPRLRCIGQSC